jgi:hypothetical protein
MATSWPPGRAVQRSLRVTFFFGGERYGGHGGIIRDTRGGGYGTGTGGTPAACRQGERGLPPVYSASMHYIPQADRMVRVVYLIGDDKHIYVIHAMPLTTRRRR